MSEEPPNEPSVELERPPSSPRRPLAYGLLVGGVIVTFFNRDISSLVGLPSVAVQIAALGLLLAGAALFYSVRQPRPDRLQNYQQAFKPLDAPTAPENPATQKPPEN